MKKLLFIVRDAAGWAGTERVLNLIASALSVDFEVELLSFAPARACFYSYPPSVRLSWLPVEAGALATNLALARFIRKARPDVLILAGLGEIKYLLAALIGRRFSFIAWEHFNAAYTYKRLNRKLAALTADYIIALTERDAEDWRRLLAPRGKVIALPNPVPAFPPTAALLASKRILAVGRLEPQKRFELLIEAFALVAHELPGWMLRIRGSGSERDKLEKAALAAGIAAQVEILPPTSDMTAEYSDASLYAMSSRFEGFPMVLLEAMAAGLPIVSVDCPNGPREIITDEVDGFLTPQGEAPPLGAAILRLARDRELRLRMGLAARSNMARYDIEIVAARWRGLLELL